MNIHDLHESKSAASKLYNALPVVTQRVLASKRDILLLVPVFSSYVTAATGYDPTNWCNLILVVGFGMMSFYQFILNIVHGSASDGTLKK